MLYLAILISVTGIVLIAIIPAQTPTVPLSQVDEHIGNIITLEGNIISKKITTQGIVFLQIADGDSRIKIVDFAGKFADYNKGQRLTCTGKVKIYKGRVELIAYD